MTEQVTRRVDPRLRAAVDASASWYTDVFATHGIASRVVDGMWCSAGPPPPLHSAALAVEPWATAAHALALVAPLERCSVADSFASLDLGAAGMDLLFTATWLHRPPLRDGPGPLPRGWDVVADEQGLAEWNQRHDTAGVLLPALLGRATFRVLARRVAGAVAGGAVAHLGTGVVAVSNVFAVAGEATDYAEVVAAVNACFPGRALVGYEWGPDLDAALAAGFAAVGEHRVWAR